MGLYEFWLSLIPTGATQLLRQLLLENPLTCCARSWRADWSSVMPSDQCPRYVFMLTAFNN
jgi:hypothetical protein